MRRTSDRLCRRPTFSLASQDSVCRVLFHPPPAVGEAASAVRPGPTSQSDRRGAQIRARRLEWRVIENDLGLSVSATLSVGSGGGATRVSTEPRRSPKPSCDQLIISAFRYAVLARLARIAPVTLVLEAAVQSGLPRTDALSLIVASFLRALSDSSIEPASSCSGQRCHRRREPDRGCWRRRPSVSPSLRRGRDFDTRPFPLTTL